MIIFQKFSSKFTIKIICLAFSVMYLSILKAFMLSMMVTGIVDLHLMACQRKAF